MKKLLQILLISIAMFVSCNKEDKTETEKKFCWQILDFQGNELSKICDKTEAELLQCAKTNNCGIYFVDTATGLKSCNYYKIDGDKSCWLINDTYYKNLYESQAQLYAKCFFGGGSATKIDCNSFCQIWYNREERYNRRFNTTTYSTVEAKNYCGDTLSRITQGKRTLRKNDNDSIIYIQFSKDGVRW